MSFLIFEKTGGQLILNTECIGKIEASYRGNMVDLHIAFTDCTHYKITTTLTSYLKSLGKLENENN